MSTETNALRRTVTTALTRVIQSDLLDLTSKVRTQYDDGRLTFYEFMNELVNIRNEYYDGSDYGVMVFGYDSDTPLEASDSNPLPYTMQPGWNPETPGREAEAREAEAQIRENELIARATSRSDDYVAKWVKAKKVRERDALTGFCHGDTYVSEVRVSPDDGMVNIFFEGPDGNTNDLSIVDDHLVLIKRRK